MNPEESDSVTTLPPSWRTFSAAYVATCLLVALAGCTEYDLTIFEGVEVFTQNPPDAVDILLVIDNSCSMEPYQQKLGANFDEFLTFFIEGNVEYQIGVVTTSVADLHPGGGTVRLATEGFGTIKADLDLDDDNAAEIRARASEGLASAQSNVFRPPMECPMTTGPCRPRTSMMAAASAAIS